MFLRLAAALKVASWVVVLSRVGNKAMTRDGRLECHYFIHLRLFPNLLEEHRHGGDEVPISDRLSVR